MQVIDTGLGIAPEEQTRIFEAFYQVHQGQRPGLGDADHPGGLGLGLSIVQRLAELLGLQLQMRSRPGHGSCFGVAFEALP